MFLVSYLLTQLRPSATVSASSQAAAAVPSNKPDRISNFLHIPFQLERVKYYSLVPSLHFA